MNIFPKSLTIATHNGKFHTDDVMAVAILLVVFPEALIIRSRDKNILANADILVDVGGSYNVSKNYFDHHQQYSPIRKDGIPYSAAGLVWKTFGEDCIISVTKKTDSGVIWEDIDNKIMIPIDKNDNGIEQTIDCLSLWSIVSSYNVPWNSKASEDEAFAKAVIVIKEFLNNRIKHLHSRILVQDKIKEGSLDHNNILILKQNIPWQETVIIDEKYKDVLFVVYPSGKENDWRIQAVPSDIGSFIPRKKFPETWGGLERMDLTGVSGVDEVNFCHKALFIAGARTLEAAVLLAEKALI